jgi:hypothetical protein
MNSLEERHFALKKEHQHKFYFNDRKKHNFRIKENTNFN